MDHTAFDEQLETAAKDALALLERAMKDNAAINLKSDSVQAANLVLQLHLAHRTHVPSVQPGHVAWSPDWPLGTKS